MERDLHEKPAETASEPQDSLVTVTKAGEEVWFTLARPGRAADGTTCVERGLEIRARGKRISVPLLYTREAPVSLNDSTIRAQLWNNCVPGDAYRVNLRTGRPVREPAGGSR
jgi:hypothetical protein